MRIRWLLGGVVGLLPLAMYAAEPSVLINELFYDAPGSDTGNEWIELLNVGSGSIDLSGWKLQRGGTTFQTVFTFPSGASLSGGQRLLLGEANVGGATYMGSFGFQNGGGATDGVRITTGDGTVVDVVLYDQPNASGLPDASGSPGTVFAPIAPAGSSLARLPDGSRSTGDSRDFSVTSALTPGAANTASSASPSSGATPSPSATSSSVTASADAVVVNEILPNPVGSDEEGEFIELWNSGTTTANLSGYKVDDAEGGSTPYVIPHGTTLAAKAYLLLRRLETKLAFNNNADRGRLLRPDGSLLHELVYDTVPKGEGSSVARQSNGSATWTSTPTPGAENQFQSLSVAASSAPAPTTTTKSSPGVSASPRASTSASPLSSSGRVRGTTTVAEAPGSSSASRPRVSGNRQDASSPTERQNDPEKIALADLRSKDVGIQVMTEGVVSVPPGVLDPRLFYVAGSGIGVVLTEGSFPELKIGDMVEISGVLAEPRKERLLAVASADKIVKKADGAPPEPHDVKTGDSGERWEGSLVRVEGTIVDASDNQFTVDDGSGPMRVRRVGMVRWNAELIKKESRVSVIGIVSESDDGFSVLPRSAEDIHTRATEAVENTASPKKPWLRWLGIGLIAAGVIVFVLRRRRQKERPSQG